MKDEIEYCGHVINKDGLCKPQNKIKAVVNAPSPQTESAEIMAWICDYHKFLPNLATELQPVHSLLKLNTPWHWKNEQETAFTRAKSMVQSDTVFTHYDPEH